MERCQICGKTNVPIHTYASQCAPYSYGKCFDCIEMWSESPSIVDLTIDYGWMDDYLKHGAWACTVYQNGHYVPMKQYLGYSETTWTKIMEEYKTFAQKLKEEMK
jgi:hypothetical protein